MSRIKSKFIKFGTGSEDVNSQVIPSKFSPTNYIPSQVASEGTDKISAHLKGIDTKLGASGGGSAGDIAETSFTLTNNQSTAANITGLVFANATVRSFEAHVSIEINATASLFETLTLKGIQRGADWVMSITSAGDTSNVFLTINNSGQIQYTNDNYSGYVSGKIKFRAITTTIG